MQVLAANDLRDAALQVTRNLPAAHWFTGFFRRAWFKQLAERFTQSVYDADVSRYSTDDFDTMESAIDIAIRAIEIHLLEHTERDHDAHRNYYQLIEKLRIAREGIIRGYPADPQKRPSDREIEDDAYRAIREACAAG